MSSESNPDLRAKSPKKLADLIKADPPDQIEVEEFVEKELETTSS